MQIILQGMMVLFLLCGNVQADVNAGPVAQISSADPIWYLDFDGDGYGDPDTSISAGSQPYGYVADNTDCDDGNLSVHSDGIEIAGDGLDQDCDGSDAVDTDLAGTIALFTPAHNATVDFQASGGNIPFSFSKVPGAAQYKINLDFRDISGQTVLSVPMDVTASGSGTAAIPGGGDVALVPAAPGTSGSVSCELPLDAGTWDALAVYTLSWGVEAYDGAGELTAVETTGPGNRFKLMARDAVVLAEPGFGAVIDRTDTAPVFKWDAVADASTYELVLAQAGPTGFDNIITRTDLTSDSLALDDATWASMPSGTWYWTVLGRDAAGNPAPSGSTLFDFEVADQTATLSNTASLKVTWPNGGQKWYAGEKRNIGWRKGNGGSHVAIYLYLYGNGMKYGKKFLIISPKTPNDGLYTWSIPGNLFESSQYKIKIESVSNSKVFDYSDANFQVSVKSTLKVTWPSGGQTWYMGDTRKIGWNKGNAGSHVSIKLYKYGKFYKTIESKTANDGVYTWAIPSMIASDSYQIRVASVSNSKIHHYSKDFKIKAKLKLSSPNGGQTWYRGDTKKITWVKGNGGSNVSLRLYKWGKYVGTISSKTANDGSFNWKISNSLPVSGGYKIRIGAYGKSSPYDYSDGYFKIASKSSNSNPGTGSTILRIKNTHGVSFTFKSSSGTRFFKIDGVKQNFKVGALGSTTDLKVSPGTHYIEWYYWNLTYTYGGSGTISVVAGKVNVLKI